MKINREFLKAVLKSLKHGKLHKLLRLILICAFLYFSFLTGKQLISFYVEQKQITKLQYRDVSLSYKSGNLILKAGKFLFNKPKLQLKASGVKISLQVWKSLKELKPNFSLIEVKEIVLNQYLIRKKEKKYLPELTVKLPFYAETISVGKFIYSTPNVKLNGNGIYIGKEKFQIGGLDGNIKGNRIHLKPLSGRVKNEELLFPDLELLFGFYKLLGNGKVKKDFSSATFNGLLKGKNSQFLFNIKKVKRNLKVSGVAKSGKFGTVYYSLRGKLGKELNISRGNVVYHGIETNFSGSFNRHEFSVAGNIVGKNFRTNTVSVGTIYGTFSGKGTYKKPYIKWNLKGSKLQSPIVSLKRTSLYGNFQNGDLNVWTKSDSLDLSFHLKQRSGSGSVKLRNFNISRLNPVSFSCERYGKWIPSVVLSGSGKFKVKNLKVASYSGNFTVNKFFFRGFSSSGLLKLKGTPQKTVYFINLSQNGEKLISNGTLDLKQLTLNSFFSAENLESSSLNFLKKVGLKGRINGEGKLWGLLKNPEGQFNYSSKKLSFRGANLGSVNGQVRVKNFYLLINGKTEKGNVVVDNLKLYLKKKMEFFLKGKTESVKVASVDRILKSLNVKVPVTLDGTVSGNFSIYSSDIKKRENLVISVNVMSYSGNFSVDKISGAVESVSGPIEYDAHKGLTLNFSGDGKSVKVEKFSFSNGNFRLTLKDDKLHILFSKFSYKMLKEGNISGNLNVGLKEKTIDGNVNANGSFEKDRVTSQLQLKLNVSGNLDDFTINIDGKTTLNHPYLDKPLNFSISGTLEEPANMGNLALKRNGDRVRVLFIGDKRSIVGSVRHVKVKFLNVTAYVKMAFINLNLNNFSGNIIIPAFDVKPDKFYKLYSVSGLYIRLNNGKPDISNTRLSYVDGWVELNDIKFKGNVLSGKLLSNTGVKGLIYLTDLKNEVKYIKGNLKVAGSFIYRKNLNYSLDFSSSGIETRLKYILGKVSIDDLKGTVENGKVTSLFGDINVGDGNVVINGNENEIATSISEISLGQSKLWKTVASGNAIFKGNKLRGELNLTKTKIFFNGNKEKTGKLELGKIPLDISLNLYFSDTVTIKGPLFSLKILPKLKFQTVNGKLIISGNFYVVNGKLKYMGKTFNVLYGTGIINNIVKEKGSIDVVASSYTSGYYIYMHIKGPFNAPKLYLSSDPPLTREQILNVIMTGASPEQVQESSEIFPAIQVAYYATANLFEPIEKQFKKVLKLENFSIEPYITKYGETVARIRLIKQLSNRFRIMGYDTTGQKPEYGGSIQSLLTKRTYLEARYNSYYGPEFGVGIELNVK